ncbi:sigma-70 family RNA polymerase sigma factor [Fulvivirgaceae bacterium BMA12]|uniref:Sigma-70 family RNA polymerase sigma factor n=1 Tax=Agaribacillus aureus TaxID=3051825 RepID=A0ABT8L280_9BACT|nr:sigma-70 family RNA polymerase sigma factor [Fulvivirgaceae bacterium BMA12]
MKSQTDLFLENFYYKNADKIFSFALGFLKSKEEAEEAVQDIFVKFWRQRDQIKDIEAYQGYLYKIAKHHLLNCIRKKAKDKIKYYELENNLKSFQSVEGQYIFDELYQQANDAISQLPPRRKQVYELKRNEGLTNRQIAEKMNISETMVEKHWRLAVSTIKDYLQLAEGN